MKQHETVNRRIYVLFLIFLLASLSPALAAPSIVSVVPANGATGASTTAAVVFTFSEAMDTTQTAAIFYTPPFNPLTTTPVWSSGNTVLSCTPSPAFPASQSINWVVSGQNPVGDMLTGIPAGSFTTGGPGGGGSGTNKITTFSVVKIHLFDQSSTAAPVIDPTNSYGFSASVTVNSNRTTTGAALTLPSTVVSNLAPNSLYPAQFLLFSSSTNLATFDNTFGSGDYVFHVQDASSNQTVTVNLPAGLVQPNAPHVANYAAAQSVDATKPFTLSWDALQNGATTNFIYVVVGNVFATTNPGVAGALNGTATSVVIPAGTLQPGTTYDAHIDFFRTAATSNAIYTAQAGLESTTSFNLNTSSSLSLTNPVWSGGVFQFDINSAAGQTFRVEASSNLLAGQWQVLLTTNSVSGHVHFSDTRSATNRQFYRAHNGP